MNGLKQTDAFRRWEANLKDLNAKAYIAARVNRLAKGLPGDVKPVGSGISELRIHYGPGYRIYFQQRGRNIVLLLCGGDKRSQQQDIFMAKYLAKIWLDEEEEDET